MNDLDGLGRRLRERFTAPPEGTEPSPGCPEAETLRLAASGKLDPSELPAVLAHVAACPACAVAWRFLREAEPVRARLGWRAPVGLALAAVVVTAIGAAVLMRRPPESASMRATGESILRSSLPDDAPLPRSAFVLRWTPGPSGTRYTVRVTDSLLAPVAEGRGLSEAEYVVPEPSLARVAEGAQLLWQVRGDLPDGTRVRSATFVVRVAGPSPP